MSYESIASDLFDLYYKPIMNRYAVEYHDKQGNGWTRLVEASDLKEVISITKVDPDVCRIKSILPAQPTRH